MATQDGKDIDRLYIRDMIIAVARHLHASAKADGNGFFIELRDYTKNVYVSICLRQSREIQGGSSILVECGNLKENKKIGTVLFGDLDHLYVTWDSDELVSFCYAQGGRYTLVNVYKRGEFTILDGIDRREDEEEPLTEEEEEARNQRRTFFHVGTMKQSDDDTFEIKAGETEPKTSKLSDLTKDISDTDEEFV